VRRSINHASATPWVMVPDAESTWLKNHNRNGRTESALKD
jgi:hypothetical protein